MENCLALTVSEWEDEEYVRSLSDTEKELHFIRQDFLNGKIKRYDDGGSENGHTCYEDAIEMTLFWAEERGKITAEESEMLSKKYA